MKRLRRCVVCLLFCTYSVTAFAVMDQALWLVPLEYELTETAEMDVWQTDIPANRIDRSRTYVARYLNYLSQGIDDFMVDVFFGEQVLDDDVGGSRLKLSYDQRYQSRASTLHTVKVSANVRFPHFNNRLRLLIESEDDPDDERSRAPIFEPLERQRFNAAVRLLLRSTEGWNTDVDVGVRGLLPPDPFTQFRARRFDQLGHWQLRTTQTLFYRVSDGLGERTALQWDYPLNTEKVIRLTQHAEYTVPKGYFDLDYGVGFYQRLSAIRAVSYQFGASGDSEDGATFYRYRAAIQYRQQVYRSWLFFDVIPEVLWQRDLGYRTTPAISFRLEALIAQ